MTKISEIMSSDVVCLPSSASILAAARQMRDADVGAVVVKDGSKVSGIVTDRDIAVRAVAEGLDPEKATLAQICSKEIATLSPEDDADLAVEVMRERAVRRVPIVDEETVIGIVSLGDLAIDRDPKSVLGQISAADPNH